MPEHVFVVLAAKAVPSLTREQILWHLPIVDANGYIHIHRILEGEVMIWPDPKLSKRGRWWLKVRQLFKRREHANLRHRADSAASQPKETTDEK